MKVIAFPLPIYRYVDPMEHIAGLVIPRSERSGTSTIAIMVDKISHLTPGPEGLTRIHLTTTEVIDVAESMEKAMYRINTGDVECEWSKALREQVSA